MSGKDAEFHRLNKDGTMTSWNLEEMESLLQSDLEFRNKAMEDKIVGLLSIGSIFKTLNGLMFKIVDIDQDGL